MNVIVTGRHFDVSDALRTYAEDKLKKFEKYLANIKEANVTLSVEKFRHKAEVSLSVDGTIIESDASTKSFRPRHKRNSSAMNSPAISVN